MTIKANRRFEVEAGLEQVWKITEDLGNLALCMPGYKRHEVYDQSHSLWVVGLNVGPFVKTLDFKVTITENDPMRRLRFEFAASNEPVHGDGTFEVNPVASGKAEVAVALSVTGKGPLASMYEAMSRPIMPVLAETFAKRLAAQISNFSANSA